MYQKWFTIEDPDGSHKGLSLPLHPTPPLIGRSRFSTGINLAQGEAQGEGIFRGREGRRERGREVGETILGFWFTFVSKVVYNGGS